MWIHNVTVPFLKNPTRKLGPQRHRKLEAQWSFGCSTLCRLLPQLNFVSWEPFRGFHYLKTRSNGHSYNLLILFKITTVSKSLFSVSRCSLVPGCSRMKSRSLRLFCYFRWLQNYNLSFCTQSKWPTSSRSRSLLMWSFKFFCCFILNWYMVFDIFFYPKDFPTTLVVILYLTQRRSI